VVATVAEYLDEDDNKPIDRRTGLAGLIAFKGISIDTIPDELVLRSRFRCATDNRRAGSDVVEGISDELMIDLMSGCCFHSGLGNRPPILS
jgi:hypothetical protein